MSIVYAGGFYDATCDVCGDTLPGEFEFMDAVQAKKDANWKSRKLADGSWEDLCPECQDKPKNVFGRN